MVDVKTALGSHALDLNSLIKDLKSEIITELYINTILDFYQQLIKYQQINHMVLEVLYILVEI
jgi:hypothetical protein